ncbi:MAG: ABC transporter ATP-binding protein [Clostridia bacterium]|jgi:branched-chain amino acid transport system ATP-binding protein|nr:ABC transporter ATP-binding protein [Clostridia bacterium]
MSILAGEKLTKNFGGLTAVSDVDFQVLQGEIFAVIGPNGAGKTTLFNMITGVLPLSGGSISFQGDKIDGMPSHLIAVRGIARTFQNLQLFDNLTVLENVMVGCHCHGKTGFIHAGLRLPQKIAEEKRFREAAMEKLRLVGLAERAHELSANLPYGQQRLLEIARALAVEPKVLLLDEPVAGLNSVESEGLAELVCRLKDMGMTILLVEHDMATVMSVADRIVVLDFGKKIAEGTPEEIQTNPMVIKAYLGEEDA